MTATAMPTPNYDAGTTTTMTTRRDEIARARIGRRRTPSERRRTGVGVGGGRLPMGKVVSDRGNCGLECAARLSVQWLNSAVGIDAVDYVGYQCDVRTLINYLVNRLQSGGIKTFFLRIIPLPLQV